MRCIVPTVTGHSCSLIATKITHTPFASLLKMQRKNAIHFFPEIYPGRVSDPINTSGSTTVPTAIPTPTFLPPPQSSPPTRKPFSRCPKPPSPSSADDWQTRRKNYRDRKSTRLNSSHQIISYAVFCLKKKKKKKNTRQTNTESI